MEGRAGDWRRLVNHIVLVVFVFQVLVKIVAVAPRFSRYFGNGWDLFNLAVSFADPGCRSVCDDHGSRTIVAGVATGVHVVRTASNYCRADPLAAGTGPRGYATGTNFLHLCAGWLPSAPRARFGSLALIGYRAPDMVPCFAPGGLDRCDVSGDGTASDNVAVLCWLCDHGHVFGDQSFIAVVIKNLDEAKKQRLEPDVNQATNHSVDQQLSAARDVLERLARQLASMD